PATGGDERGSALDLRRRDRGAAKRRMALRRLRHLGIGVRGPEAVEVEAPSVEPGRDQRVAPRATVESVRDRQRRREGAAVHVEPRRPRRRQAAKEQAEPRDRARDTEMLLPRNELRLVACCGAERGLHGASPASGCGGRPPSPTSTQDAYACRGRTLRPPPKR